MTHKTLRQSDIAALVDLQCAYTHNTQPEDITAQHSHAYRQMFGLGIGSWTLYRGCLIQRIDQGFRCEDPRQMQPQIITNQRTHQIEVNWCGQMCDKTFSMPALVVAWLDARLEEAAA
jgi:hypothetical protein